MSDSSNRPLFDFEKLDVYQVALDYWETAVDAEASIREGKAAIRDQLLRAALSIGLNIAEGAGEYSKQEKARFYRMARRSATECAGILNACERAALLLSDQVGIGRDLLYRVVSMLTKMILKLEQAVADNRTSRKAGSRKTAD